MNIFLDLDYTLLAFDGSLRPLALQVLSRLREKGHRVYIWSGLGVRTEEVRQAGLDALVCGVFQKPVDNLDEGLARCGVPVRPDLVVDDHEEIVRHFGGVVVRPYFWPDPDDREMERVYRVIQTRLDGKERRPE